MNLPTIIDERGDKVRKQTYQKCCVYDTWSADGIVCARVIF